MCGCMVCMKLQVLSRSNNSLTSGRAAVSDADPAEAFFAFTISFSFWHAKDSLPWISLGISDSRSTQYGRCCRVVEDWTEMLLMPCKPGQTQFSFCL